jgi:hypothetical protein
MYYGMDMDMMEWIDGMNMDMIAGMNMDMIAGMNMDRMEWIGWNG